MLVAAFTSPYFVSPRRHLWSNKQLYLLYVNSNSEGPANPSSGRPDSRSVQPCITLLQILKRLLFFISLFMSLLRALLLCYFTARPCASLRWIKFSESWTLLSESLGKYLAVKHLRTVARQYSGRLSNPPLLPLQNLKNKTKKTHTQRGPCLNQAHCCNIFFKAPADDGRGCRTGEREREAGKNKLV